MFAPRVALVAAMSFATPAAQAEAPPAYEYHVKALDGARELSVEARFVPAVRDCYEVDRGFAEFVSTPEILGGGRWRPIARRDECFDVRAGKEATVRYRFRLADASAPVPGQRRRDIWMRDGVAFGRPSAWLLRPRSSASGRFRLRFSPAGNVSFVSGLTPTAPDTYEGLAAYLDGAPYGVIGPVKPSRLEVGGGTVEWLVTGETAARREEIERWIERAARSVSEYFGRFPIPRVLVIVVPGSRGGAGGGTTWGYGGASIRMGVGPGASREVFDADWVLPHEMVHLALPNLPRRQRWMEEGLATYVEPIARRRARQLKEDDVWSGFIRGMPQGLPKDGDEGLDRTPTWGRTYWGGALFWLLADVALLEKTEGRVGLDDLLRGTLAEGGDIRTRWDLPQLLDVADRVAGAPIVRDLHTRLALAPGTTDLEALWARLGVRLAKDGRTITYDDAAPLAWVRRRISGGPKVSEPAKRRP